VWTGEQLIVWGGLSYATGTTFQPAVTSLDDGGVYDLASDTWQPIASQGAPHGGLAPFVWSGKELIVISKLDGYGTPGQILFEGARFNPRANTWSPMSAPTLELADKFEFANLEVYWLGSVLAVFGVKVDHGIGRPALLLYEPESDSWSSGTLPSTQPSFTWQSATVVGDRLVVVTSGAGSADARGAYHSSTVVMVFDEKTRAWTKLPELLNRSAPYVVALPHQVLVWGGRDIYTDLDAPNPCLGASTPCDPITPTRQTLLADGVGISY
jgi:hypothetical protein